MVRLAPLAPRLLLGAVVAIAGCGSEAAAGGDPVSVTTAYMSAIQGNPDGGKAFLMVKSDQKLVGTTSASRFVAAHKGAKWSVVRVKWQPPGQTSEVNTKSACLVGDTLCVVTVQVEAGGTKAWFHFAVEKRYGPWQIIAVDEVDKAPDDLLPNGSEAHRA